MRILLYLLMMTVLWSKDTTTSPKGRSATICTTIRTTESQGLPLLIIFLEPIYRSMGSPSLSPCFLFVVLIFVFQMETMNGNKREGRGTGGRRERTKTVCIGDAGGGIGDYHVSLQALPRSIHPLRSLPSLYHHGSLDPKT